MENCNFLGLWNKNKIWIFQIKLGKVVLLHLKNGIYKLPKTNQPTNPQCYDYGIKLLTKAATYTL